MRVEIEIAESGHLRPLAWNWLERPLGTVWGGHLRQLATMGTVWGGHLRPLAATRLERPLAATRLERPLAATCGHSSGCELQVAASGCKWLRVAASGCEGLRVAASTASGCE